MPKSLYILVSIAVLSVAPAYAGFCPGGTPNWQQWLDQGEPYSKAVCYGEDPRNHFEVKKAELEQATNETIRLERLASTAKAALEAGLNEEAESYAEQALALAREGHFRDARLASQAAVTQGDALHLANVVMGRLALLSGDVAEAESFLLASGKIRAAPLTASFGPNMTLARELIKLHRTEVVLHFFEECKTFWQLNEKYRWLERWSEEVREGIMPDFGANLIYY
jgi:hypothetical protein